jgi:hypothetical protein
MVKRNTPQATTDPKYLPPDLQVSEEGIRDDGVRSFCPCHAGWEVFEKNVSVVLRSLRDPSRVVRAHAIHVFEDAARNQSASDLRYYVEAREKRLNEKRACSRFRSMEERLEARRNKRISKHKERHSKRGRQKYNVG